MEGSRVLLQFLVEEGSVSTERIEQRQLALQASPKAHRDRAAPVQKRLHHQKWHQRVSHRLCQKRIRSVDLKFILRFSVFLKCTDEFKYIHKIEKIVNLNIPLNVHPPPLQVMACKSNKEGRPDLVSGKKRKARKPMKWDVRALIEIRKEQKRTKLSIPKAPIARYVFLSMHVKLVAI